MMTKNNSTLESDRINKEQQENKQMSSEPNENSGVRIEGHIKIWDPTSGEVLVDKRNAIHYENFSNALALSVGNQQQGWIHEMAFGNGGTSVDPTGIITYLPTNTTGSNAALYNQTYYKVVDVNSIFNKDPTRNLIEARHVPGTVYTDVLVSCLLDYGEPTDQAAFDNSTSMADNYVFDELGLKSYNPNGVDTGDLLTHVIFHPVQKSLNRIIQIDYTVRIQTLTNLTSQL
jgi:hypothetical protein